MLLLPTCLTHSTLVGEPSLSAMLGAPRMWQAMSPSDPQPYSKKPRQLNGAILSLYACGVLMPVQRSQDMVSGTGISAGQSGRPCGQIGRLVQAWTSVTLPISPDQTISAHCRVPSLEYPWLP